MKTYLNTLNEREKWLLAVGLVSVVLYIYYSLLYSPLEHQVRKKSAQLTEKIALLEWMSSVKQQDKGKQSRQRVDNNQLLAVLATRLKEEPSLNLAFPYQLQQTGSGDIQLSFSQVAFNLFIHWLKKINQDYLIEVKQFDAKRTKNSGVVQLTILLSAG